MHTAPIQPPNDIILKPKRLYGKLNAIGIHLLEPTIDEINDALYCAECDGFPAVYVYIDIPLTLVPSMQSFIP